MASERNIFGEYRRSTEERPLTEKQQGRWDRGVARVMEQAKRLHGPADDRDAVVAQRLYLVRAGLMTAREAFAPRPTR